MTRQVTIDFPEEAMKAINVSPERFPKELREAAVIRWFEEGKLSQGQASSFLSITRGEFFDLLSEHGVSPVQMSAKDLSADLQRA